MKVRKHEIATTLRKMSLDEIKQTIGFTLKGPTQSTRMEPHSGVDSKSNNRS